MKLPWTQLIEHLEQQIKDEREMHAKELSRVLDENKRLQDECERLRLTLGQPSRAAEPPPEPPKPEDPDAMPAFRGTPWQIVQQKEMWFETPAGKRWMERQIGTLKVQPSGEIAVMQKAEGD